jgi:hypothetical protein
LGFRSNLSGTFVPMELAIIHPIIHRYESCVFHHDMVIHPVLKMKFDPAHRLAMSSQNETYQAS